MTASLGISIEPLPDVDAQVSSLRPQSAGTNAVALPPPSTTVLTQRIVTNLYNFLTGYAVDAQQITPTEQFVPLRVCPCLMCRSPLTLQAFQEWHTKFLHRLQNDTTFLDRDRD